jgi:hypothetical protein
MSEWKNESKSPNLEGNQLGDFVSNLIALKDYYEKEARQVQSQIHALERVQAQLKEQNANRKVDPNG